MGETTLLDVLEAGQDPDRPALVVPDGPELTYRRLGEEVRRAAELLAARGVRRGDRVALVYPNSAEAVVLFLAAATAGTAAPLNPAYKVDEFRFYLEDTGAQALVVAPGGAPAARQALPSGAVVIEAAFDTTGRLRFEGSQDRRDPDPCTPDDVALVLHTSGTTSRPKMVPLRQRNLAASVGNIVPHYRLGPDDVSLCVMPLFHVHGLMASAMATLASGGTVVVAAPGFNPFEFWGLVRRFRPTWYSAVPTIHRAALGRAPQGRPEGLDRLRFVRSCSSALSPDLLRQLEDRYGVPVLEAYGMTEGSHQIASNPLPPQARKPGTVGRGTGVEVVVLDEKGDRLPQGGAGEVSIRGPSVMDGYEANPAANREAFSDGWFRTGDLGTIDADGYVTLLGRIKELINRGGEKIAPREIDEVLLRHPAVAEAVAFGVPDQTWGEEVAAAVVLKGEADRRQLLAFCRQHLADFKVPRQLYIVDEIPRTPTGKVQRRQVAAAFTER